MRVMLLAGLFIATACSRAPGASETVPAISGIVFAGPSCPEQLQATPCPDRPMKAEIQVIEEASGRTVITVFSGEDGRFRVAVPPGEYILRAAGPRKGLPPFPAVTKVVVQPGRVSHVTLRLDTGIR